MHPSIPRMLATATLLGLAGCKSTAPSTGPGVTSAQSNENASVHSQSKSHAAGTHPDLRAQLLDLRDRDQAARKAMIELISKQERNTGGGFQVGAEDYPILLAVQNIDAESTAFLKNMVETHGWPTFDMVGEDGASAAWILAQHADADAAFQARVLALMEPLVHNKQAHGHEFAMLTDRVLRAKGEPQLYGTQFMADEQGVQRPGPTIDWETVDERRAAVGLPSIEIYAEKIRETYGGEVSTEPMPIEDVEPLE